MATTTAHAFIGRVRFRPHIGFVAANTLFAAIFTALVLSMFHAPSPHGVRRRGGEGGAAAGRQ